MRWWQRMQRMLARQTEEERAQRQTQAAAAEADENLERVASLQARLGAAMAQYRDPPPDPEGEHA